MEGRVASCGNDWAEHIVAVAVEVIQIANVEGAEEVDVVGLVASRYHLFPENHQIRFPKDRKGGGTHKAFLASLAFLD